MARRGRGTSLLIIGCLLLCIAGGWFLYNNYEDKNAGRQAEEILSRLDAAQKEQNAPVTVVQGEGFCGKVIIEKISVKLPVYDKFSYAQMKSAPCRYSGSLETNDIVIVAHNYKSHFGSLSKLAVGDEVKFIDAYGNEHLFEVQKMAILDGTAVSDMQSGDWDFTLFTCTRSGKQRVTVRCNYKSK